MMVSSILSPLLEQIREDVNLDFCDSSVSSMPRWPNSTDDGTNYQLEDDLYHAFRVAGYAQLRHIGVTFDRGRVELQGRVPTYFLKQVAQSVVSSHPGVQRVVNNIEVVCSH